MNTAGWHWPLNTRRAHYYVDGRSLCGTSMVLYRPTLEDDNHESKDNCAKCKKVRLKLWGEKQTEATE